MVSMKRLLYEPIDAPAPFVLTIGEHCKRIPQLSRGHHISPIHLPRQRIVYQLHADPIEVLDDQKILNTTELLQQLIGAEALHSNRGIGPSPSHGCRTRPSRTKPKRARS
jgi:hypothetical protein